MQFKNYARKILKYILILMIFLMEFQYVHTAYAATLRYYNFSTGSTVNYTGKQVIYTYNSRELPLSYPGIIINGTALADFEELFVNELGLQASLEGNDITFTDGTTVLKITLDSKKAIVNGESKSMNVAPIKISFDGNVKYYVPTRFIAEAFGYSYVWISSSSTAKITKTLYLTVGENDISYNGTLYSVNYKEQTIPLAIPVIYYNGAVLAPAKTVFEAAGCAFEETSQSIRITKGNISICMELNNKTTVINEKKFIMNIPPVQITEKSTGVSSVYVPLEFVAEMLGFELTYNDYARKYTLLENAATGKAELHSELKNLLLTAETAENTVVAEEQPQIDYYYEWIAEDTTEKAEGYNYLTKVAAYSVENADVLELYGITRENIKDFVDSGVLIFELNSVIANMDAQFYADFKNPYITYTLLTEVNGTTKLLFLVRSEDTWHFVETEDCLKVYFMSADLSLEDLLISSEGVTVEEVQSMIYPDDKLVLPVSQDVTAEQFSDQDNYLENNFQIMISGNYLDFYETHPIINPYYLIKDYSISYNAETNQTILTFYTNSICGYTYTLENGYLAVTVARPNEIYSKIIVLDAGHGGNDPGAVRDNYKEKNLNFTILNTYVRELFEASDIKVYFTRESDVLINLYDRAKFASEVGADMFLSLHMNASELTSVAGTQVFYSSANNKTQASGLNSYKLAKTLAANLSVAMDTRNRGAAKADYVVVKHNTVPAVLIELGFMSNQEELAKLTSATYQKKAAETIYQTVVEMFETYPTGR